MRRKLLEICGLAILLATSVPALSAQDQSDAPKPAMAGDTAAALQSNTPADIPDTRPLAGVQNLSLGGQATSHSFLVPSFGVTTQVQFNPYSGLAGNSSLASITYLSGRLALNKVSDRSELLLDYLTAGGFSNYSNQGNAVIQNLDFSETLRSGRWQQMFGEQFSYLPASSFDFSGLGSLGNLGVSLGGVGNAPSFRPDLIPNQSIFTTGSDRISNTAIAQTTYALGYRSSLNFFATYGNLHFLESGFQNNSTINTGAGYNYLLSPLNSMSIFYGFSRLMLSHQAFGVDSHNVQLSFARRITGRLSFQAGAGPDFQFYKSPLAGSNMVVNWVLSSALSYQLRNWGTGFNYNHSLAGGSGILPGAEADVFSGRAVRTLGNWQLSLLGGYSRNGSLEQTSASSITSQGWFAGAQISRSLVNFGNVFLTYNASGQSNLAAACALSACRTTGTIHTVSLGYNWGLRPIVLQ